jgi:hypothetical protein
MSNVVVDPVQEDSKVPVVHAKFANFATVSQCHTGVPDFTIRDMLHTLQMDFSDVDYGRRNAANEDADEDGDNDDEDEDD